MSDWYHYIGNIINNEKLYKTVQVFWSLTNSILIVLPLNRG